MGRARLFLSSLAVLILSVVPGLAQVGTAMKIVTDADCSTEACTAASPSQYCRVDASPRVLYACDTSTGFYVAVASVDQAQTYTALHTFNAGITASGGGSGGSVTVAAGSKIGLEGQSGDSYLLRDADTGFIEIYLDGTLKATVTPNGVVPGACATDDLRAASAGTYCYDQENGRWKFKDPDGAWQF